MKRCKLRRRDFITGGGAAILGLGAPGVFAEMTRHPLAGAVLPKWEAGHLRIGMIYTGRSESQLLVFPDGTSLLIDCGDFVQGGDTAVPHLPKNAWRAGEATARYVLRENPNGKKLDYFLLTHYHNDHFGSPSFSAGRSARYSLSGFGQALGFLDVDTIIDRAWPDMNNPAPRADTYDASVILHIKECYAEAVRRGSNIEKYRLEKGSSQICMRHGGNAPFAVEPFCANGCVLRRDGSVLDLGTATTPRSKFGENALSIGFIVTLGAFRYFTAGDFSGRVAGPDGKASDIEVLAAPELSRVDVAKANHHGHGTMPAVLVAALAPRVVLCCNWNTLQMSRPTMRRLAAGPRKCLIAPGVFAAKRRAEDAAEDWLKDVVPESFEGAHAVVDVAPDGKTYRLMMVAAADDSWRVLGAYDFTAST